MRFYPRRVPKDGQGECDHMYSPVLGPDNVPIGQHCPLCNQFNSMDEVRLLWAEVDVKRAVSKAQSAAEDQELDLRSRATWTILGSLFLITILVLLFKHYGLIVFPPLGV